MVRALLVAGLLAFAAGGAGKDPASSAASAPREDAQPSPRMVIVAYDRQAGRAAAVWLGQRQPADDLHASGQRIALVMTTTSNDLVPTELLGHATGRDGPRERLAQWIRKRNEPRDVIAGWADAQGVSSFEGQACTTCRVAIRGDVLVLGIDVSEDTVHEAAQRVAAVDGDAVERLIAFATRSPYRWPQRGTPSIELVAQYGDDVVESVRAPAGRRGARVLMREHLWALARQVTPYWLGEAREACHRDSTSEACTRAARRVRKTAYRALDVFTRNEDLRDAVSEATRMLERAQR